MKTNSSIELGSVQQTLLLPLWGRAVETKKRKPLLIDNKAVSIIENLDYDFSVLSNNVSRLSQLSWVARSIFFDKKIKAFIAENPEATIVNIGCGLDTTFDRVDNGTIKWIDLDLPDTIALRKKYISETDRRKFIPLSVFDTNWYKNIQNPNQVMLLIAGVLYYFDEAGVKHLFSDFHAFIPGAEVVFDYSSRKGVEIANKKVIEKGGMDKEACLKWGIDNIFETEKWDGNIQVKSNMPMFREHKKNFPLVKRLGMNISDMLKIMSLARIKIS
jgi:O-methyltransferase involved in polyketide biosynthesis